jgi:hypothetical protein
MTQTVFIFLAHNGFTVDTAKCVARSHPLDPGPRICAVTAISTALAHASGSSGAPCVRMYSMPENWLR